MIRAALLAAVLILAGCWKPAEAPSAPPEKIVPHAPPVVQSPSFRPPDRATQYRAPITREATFALGVSAPVPLLAGQIAQESSWGCNVTARDGGMGCAQFMEATAGWLAKTYPELGGVRPYDPVWAFQAQARLNKFNLARVQGVDECNKWAVTLLAYNAGLGIVQGIQKASPQPGVYWGVTELLKYKQSDANHKSSRDYPHRIVYRHQPNYAAWGRTVCI